LFNGKLSLDDLKALELRNVSLLTFSACETAANDGRSGKAPAIPTTASTFSDPFYWAPFILIGDWRSLPEG
jgi:CHAT domain-containing protein